MPAIIDTHIYLLGNGSSGSGCSIPEKVFSSMRFRETLSRAGLNPDRVTDQAFAEAVLGALERSSLVSKGILLATDAVYRNGRRIENSAFPVTPNDHVMRVARKSPRALFGASVHPYRQPRSVLDETERCIDEGAVLFHWMPHHQMIDPLDVRCIPFYLALARSGKPLIFHFTTQSSPLSRACGMSSLLEKIRTALDIGVRVIVSLCLSIAESGPRGNCLLAMKEVLGTLSLATERKWELYADISPCIAHGNGAASQVLMHYLRLGHVESRRFVFGSHFPVINPDCSRGPGKDDLRPETALSPLDERIRPFFSGGELPDITGNAARLIMQHGEGSTP